MPVEIPKMLPRQRSLHLILTGSTSVVDTLCSSDDIVSAGLFFVFSTVCRGLVVESATCLISRRTRQRFAFVRHKTRQHSFLLISHAGHCSPLFSHDVLG